MSSVVLLLSELLALQSALASAFPDCQDLNLDPGRGITHFVPHLSLGQWKKRSQLIQDMEVGVVHVPRLVNFDCE
jgi:hypothetical protein